MPMRGCGLLVSFAAGLLLAGAIALAGPNARSADQPETTPAATPADASTFLARVRAAYTQVPVTERLRISVQRPGGATRRSLLLVRTEPSPDGTQIDRVFIRAGRLLIDARGPSNSATGFVRAALHAQNGPMFEAPATTGTVAAALAGALPPLPIAQLDLAAATSGEQGCITAYACGVNWSNSPSYPRAGEAQLDGRSDHGSIALTVDRTTWRLRRVQITIDARPDGGNADGSGGASITIDHAPSIAQLAAIRPDAGGAGEGSPRPRVKSPSALMAGVPMSAVGSLLALEAEPDGSVLLRAATQDAQGRPRPAMILLLGASDPSHDPAVRTLVAMATELAAGSEPLQAGVLVTWDPKEGDSRSWPAITPPRQGETPVASGGSARGGEELARIAPGAAGAFIVVSPDREILAVHPLEQLPIDPEQQVAELLMSLLDAVHESRVPAGREPK